MRSKALATAPCDPTFHGVDEEEPLDFHSPYGCSKGAADQYVRDYARIYDLPTVVFRMSCIAGPRQFGNEDQGWVAHFLYSVLEGRPITIYGDGYQVRDILHVHDLIDAMLAARAQRSATAGEIYNVGGGMERAVSVAEMLAAIERETGSQPICVTVGTRPATSRSTSPNTDQLTAHTDGDRAAPHATSWRLSIKFWLANQALIAGQRGHPRVPVVTAQEVA